MIEENTGEQPSSISPEAPKRWPHGPTRFEQRFGNNVTRIVVAVVAVPLILGVVFLGGWWFALLVAVMSTGALLEFYWMLEKRGIYANKTLGVVAGLLLLLPFAHGDFELLLSLLIDNVPGKFGHNQIMRDGWAIMQYAEWRNAAIPGVMLVTVLTTLILGLRHDNRQALRNGMGTLMGFFYVSFFMATLLGVHHLVTDNALLLVAHEHNRSTMDVDRIVPLFPELVGGAFVMVMLVGIWTCDSFAYFGGRAFGRHKLFERVSPKKTWEGAITGAVAAVGICIGLSTMLEGLVWYDGLFIGIAAGVFGQIGDLVESHIKRGCEIKDSSQIIPGHGGVLDRFDSLLFVAPLVYIYMMIVVLSLR